MIWYENGMTEGNKRTDFWISALVKWLNCSIYREMTFFRQTDYIWLLFLSYYRATSDARSQNCYRWVSREYNPHLHHLPPHTHRQSQLQHHKCTFSHFSIRSSHTNGLMDQRINGQTKPLQKLRVCNLKGLICAWKSQCYMSCFKPWCGSDT